MKILAIKFKFLGDVAILEASLRKIHEHFPEAEIQVLVQDLAVEILEPLPYVKKVWGVAKKDKKNLIDVLKNLRKERFNYSLDFAGNDRGAWMTRLIGARYRMGIVTTLGFLGRKYMYNIRVKEGAYGAHEILRDFELLEPLIGKIEDNHPCIKLSCYLPYLRWAETKISHQAILCHLSTSMQKKEWPLDSWIQLGKTFLDEGVQVVFTSGPSVREQKMLGLVKSALPNAVGVDEIPSIGRMMALIKTARLTISGDTVISHLASGLDVHHLTLFGPSIVQQWEPRGEKSKWIWGGTCDCFGHPRECYREDHNMKRISVEQVVETVRGMDVF